MAQYYDYVLVGGGVASVWAAQNIRELDKAGRIALIGAETHPPYDRPPLSKGMIRRDDVTPDDAYSKFDDFYPKNSVDLFKATRVTQIDRAAQGVTLESGEMLNYGKLLIATGARARKLDVPGADRPNVYTLRTIEDALAIREAAKRGGRVVLIGAGYIGMEVGADVGVRGLDVTIVAQESTPWGAFASERLGRFFQSYYEAKGVRFVLNESVTAIEGEGESGPANTVVTGGGQRLPADFVVVGVGAEPNTELAQAAGLEIADDGGVRVNEFLQTSDPNIWAAGDVAHFTDIVTGKAWRVEHHLNAKWQGQAVGKNMAGANQPYERVPYFFTEEFDLYMTLRGDPQGGKHTVVAGDPDSGEFTELAYNDAGILTCGIVVSHEEKTTDAVGDILERLLLARTVVKGREAEIAAPGFDLATLG